MTERTPEEQGNNGMRRAGSVRQLVVVAGCEKKEYLAMELLIVLGLTEYISVKDGKRVNREFIERHLNDLNHATLVAIYRAVLTRDMSTYSVNQCCRERIIFSLLWYYDYGTVWFDFLPEAVQCRESRRVVELMKGSRSWW